MLSDPETQVWCNEGRKQSKHKGSKQTKKAKAIKGSAEANGSGRRWGKLKAQEEDKSDGTEQKGTEKSGTEKSRTEAERSKANGAKQE